MNVRAPGFEEMGELGLVLVAVVDPGDFGVGVIEQTAHNLAGSAEAGDARGRRSSEVVGRPGEPQGDSARRVRERRDVEGLAVANRRRKDEAAGDLETALRVEDRLRATGER